MNDFLYLVSLSLLSSSLAFIIYRVLIERKAKSKFIEKRFSILESQLESISPANARKTLSSHKILIESQALRFGDRVVRNSYRTRLRDLSNQVGGTSEGVYSTLLKRKIYFSVIGLTISFLLVSQGKWTLVLPTLLVTSFAYFLPNLFAILRKSFSRGYGRKLGEMATFSGGRWQDQESLIRAKITFALIAFVAGYVYSIVSSGSITSIGLAFAGVILGFFVPDVVLYNDVAKRREKFAEMLPDSIDLLSMCVNAGLAFPAALAKVSELQKGPVPDEFIRVRTEVQLGKDRNEALREMASRIKLEALNNFVNAVSQVDRFGIPISSALQQQSIELRAERKAKGREKAQKVPIKILGPVMLCFLPCVLLIVLGPAIIGILGIF